MGDPEMISLHKARKLINTQFPQYKNELLTPIGAQGTDNQIFRLGDDKCARFPRVEWAAETAAREQALMARFQNLPLKVPCALGLGAPAFEYPWEWSVAGWVEGSPLGMRRLTAIEATLLAYTIEKIRHAPIYGNLSCGQENYGRGGPLHDRDELFEKAAVALSDEYDISALRRIWSNCLESADKTGTAVFLHGDLHGGNLVEQDGQLAGLIDWGLAGVGDGACDLSAAWCLCDNDVRTVFRAAVQPSEAEWMRGVGWALSIACIYVAYYRDKPDVDCSMSRRTICEVLADFT